MMRFFIKVIRGDYCKLFVAGYLKNHSLVINYHKKA